MMNESHSSTPSKAVRLFGHLKTMEWKLYSSLLLRALLPSVYSSVRLYLLGTLPSDAGVNIASQVAWLALTFEVLQELLIMPLYFILGSTITNQVETRCKVKTGILMLIIAFALISAVLYATASSFPSESDGPEPQPGGGHHRLHPGRDLWLLYGEPQ